MPMTDSYRRSWPSRLRVDLRYDGVRHQAAGVDVCGPHRRQVRILRPELPDRAMDRRRRAQRTGSIRDQLAVDLLTEGRCHGVVDAPECADYLGKPGYLKSRQRVDRLVGQARGGAGRVAGRQESELRVPQAQPGNVQHPKRRAIVVVQREVAVRRVVRVAVPVAGEVRPATGRAMRRERRHESRPRRPGPWRRV